MRNSTPTGLFGNATSTNIARNLWVSDEGQDRIYAYDLVSKTEIAANIFNTLGSGNTSPWGIWANSATMWVASETFKEIYAYDMWTTDEQGNPVWDRSRDSNKDLDELKTTNRQYQSEEFKGGFGRIE